MAVGSFIGASGQGLISGPEPLGASEAHRELQARLKQQVALMGSLKSKFKAAPQSANAATLGASGDMSNEAAAHLLAAPSTYNAADVKFTGGKRVVPAPRDQQPCATCVAQAVVAAAEAAVASRTGKDVQYELEKLSVQDFYYCSYGYRDCGTGWNTEKALEELTKRGPVLLQEKCMPYNTGPREETEEAMCGAAAPGKHCSSRGAVTQQGRFSFKPLTEFWEVQKHIIIWGAVVTKFDIYDDLKPFFANAQNAKRVYTPALTAALKEPHAIALIGYSNEGNGYWIARNSWGQAFADNGDFRVAYGAAGVLQGNTFGVMWTPTTPSLEPSLPLSKTSTPGCFDYKALSSDLLTRIAWRAKVPLSKLIDDNAAVIQDADASLGGKTLRICGARLPQEGDSGSAPQQQAAGDTPPQPAASTPQPAAPPASGDKEGGTAGQLRALMGVKAALDTKGGLGSWSESAGANGGYCKAFNGVSCDSGGSVTEIALNKNVPLLGGTLPAASVLRGLPKLTTFKLIGGGVSGTLPADWGTLTQLEALHVEFNPGIVGTIPSEWGSLSSLKNLYVRDNKLQGTLAPQFGSSWPLMEELLYSGNSFSGPIPIEYAKMSKLRILALDRNKLSGTLAPQFGSSWPAMTDLWLSSNALTGSVPAEWSKMNKLRLLYSSNNLLSGTLAPEFGSGWPVMERLGFGGNAFTGSIPREWSKMEKMVWLYLNDNKLSGTLPPDFGGSWRFVERLHLNDNGFTGSIPKEWSGFGKLQLLGLHNNRLSGSLAPDLVSGWRSLEEIILNGNDLSGKIPTEFGKLTHLRRLDLVINAFSGTLPSEWGSLSHLEVLGLLSNNLEGTVPASWGQLTSLKRLFLYRNPRLTGCIPQGISLDKLLGPDETPADGTTGTQLTGKNC